MEPPNSAKQEIDSQALAVEVKVECHKVDQEFHQNYIDPGKSSTIKYVLMDSKFKCN